MRRIGWASVLLCLLVPGLSAQAPVTASGHVVRFTAEDTVGMPGVQVVLHRVGRALQGPIDSTISGPGGAFRFRWSPDTSAVYLLSAGFAGIEYFSSPLIARDAAPDTGLVLVVSDTSSTAPLVTASRHIVVSRPAKDGTRSTLEIVVLTNPGTISRIAGDSAHPSWATRLPAGALGFSAGNGDVSADAMTTRNDSVLLFAPVAPGEKQLVYTYELPAAPGTVRLPLGDSIGVLNLLLEEREIPVSGAGIARADSQSIEGRTFQQWVGAARPGMTLEIAFGGSTTRWLLPVMVGLVGVVLLVVAGLALRRPARVPAAAHRSTSLEQLADLDARYAGGAASVPPEEWARYQVERARLKAELERELARGSASS